jgi:hypothetical protein
MKINLAFWDRLLRFFIGVLFAGWAIAGGPWWAYVGIYMILTSGWGLDPIYYIFRIRTAKLEDRSTILPD